MSKTLRLGLYEKFELICSYCGADVHVPTFVNGFMYLIAEFTDKKRKPILFYMKLGTTKQGTYLIASAYTSDNQFAKLQSYADPETVIRDLGKEVFDEQTWKYDSENLWELSKPADLETFIRKFAILEELTDKEKLFSRLIRKDNI